MSNSNQNRFEDLYNDNEDLTTQRENDDSIAVHYDPKNPPVPSTIRNKPLQTQIEYLQTQLENVRKVLANKQARIYELETALKQATIFTPANEFTVSDNNEQDLFNINHNPYWIILHEIGHR